MVSRPAGDKCDDLKQLLAVIINDVLTPAGDAPNAPTLTTQITNLVVLFLALPAGASAEHP